MVENDNLITFDFIWKCWKDNIFPSDFDEALKKYLDLKAKIFVDVDIKEAVPMWFVKIAIAIEIGLLRDQQKFVFYKNYWEHLLNKKWIASIEDRWITWQQ